MNTTSGRPLSVELDGGDCHLGSEELISQITAHRDVSTDALFVPAGDLQVERPSLAVMREVQLQYSVGVGADDRRRVVENDLHFRLTIGQAESGVVTQDGSETCRSFDHAFPNLLDLGGVGYCNCD